MGHARPQAVVPTEVRRSSARHQLFENPLLVRRSSPALRASRFAVRTANQWPTRDFNDMVRRYF